MITDLELAQACADSYNPDTTWWRMSYRDELWVALRQLPGGTAVVFRGSEVARDWLRDFRGLPWIHPALGPCHGGFLEDMDDAGAWVATSLPEGPVAITGHSLGAARALILAGLLTAAGSRRIVRVATFGTPKPGFQQLSDIIMKGGYPVTCYRNGPDPVAEVPFTVAPMFPYVKPVADTPLHVAPAEAWDRMNWHHEQLYLAGLKGLAEAAPAA